MPETPRDASVPNWLGGEAEGAGVEPTGSGGAKLNGALAGTGTVAGAAVVVGDELTAGFGVCGSAEVAEPTLDSAIVGESWMNGGFDGGASFDVLAGALPPATDVSSFPNISSAATPPPTKSNSTKTTAATRTTGPRPLADDDFDDCGGRVIGFWYPTVADVAGAAPVTWAGVASIA
ncbi:MAG: hypothetical protein KDA55_17955 [Planctomycetales bacterium]|nr:hypothetical protein [Planctomycetales bacterium]